MWPSLQCHKYALFILSRFLMDTFTFMICGIVSSINKPLWNIPLANLPSALLEFTINCRCDKQYWYPIPMHYHKNLTIGDWSWMYLKLLQASDSPSLQGTLCSSSSSAHLYHSESIGLCPLLGLFITTFALPGLPLPFPFLRDLSAFLFFLVSLV